MISKPRQILSFFVASSGVFVFAVNYVSAKASGATDSAALTSGVIGGLSGIIAPGGTQLGGQDYSMMLDLLNQRRNLLVSHLGILEVWE